MSIIGIGTDIVRIDRMAKLWGRYNLRFAARILTSDEITELKEITDQNKAIRFLAKRFAVKEAVAKALGIGFRKNVFLTQIGVKKDELGKPYIVYYKKTKDYIESLGNIKTHISLSDESDVVLTFAIIED